MPKIVNKQKKRTSIAKASIDLFIDKGFSKLTISEVAKIAGIGKGTVYEYFDSKEDIIYEIMRSTQDEYDESILKNIETTKSPKEKVLHLFGLCILNDDETIKRRKIYREFMIVCLNNRNSDVSCFKIDSKDKYLKILVEILEKGIEDNLLKTCATQFAEGLFLMGEGYLALSKNEDRAYNGDVLISHIDSLFKLLEEKK